MSRTRMLSRFNGIATRVFCGVAGACLAAMMLVVLLQVFCRYVLNAPLSWPEEASRFMMVWMTFLVAPFAYREGMLVRLESWVAYLPKRGQRVIEIGTHILIALTLIVLLREALWMIERGSRIRSSALNLSMGWVFAVMPVSFVLLLSVTCELTIATFFAAGKDSETIVHGGETQ